MGGLFGAVGDSLFGKMDKAETSDSFQNLKSLGSSYSKWLLERMNTPTTELPEWAAGKGAIQDAVGQQGAAARQRLGDSGVTSGFLDSGQIVRGNADIARAEMTSFSSALRDLFMQLETSKYSGVLPYLSGGASENMGIETANLQGSLQARQQNIDYVMDFMKILSGGM